MEMYTVVSLTNLLIPCLYTGNERYDDDDDIHLMLCDLFFTEMILMSLDVLSFHTFKNVLCLCL